jgi:signal transduction histidine kinase
LISDVLTVSRGNADGGDVQHPEPAPSVVGATESKSGSLSVLRHLSHEIRTPLHSMLALAQLLRDGMAGDLNPEQRKYVEVIERNGQNLIHLVNDVLDLSRMEVGQIEIEMEVRPLDLGDQVRATVAALAPLAEVKKIDLTVDSIQDLPLVRCDPDRVRQVLTNLIGNAIKFTDRGQVVLSVEPRHQTVAVHVSDTGVGIPESARPRLFDAFFQGAGPQARRKGGAGLGLAIASRLVRLMGGDLSFESAEGVGSRFTFTLPIAEAVGGARVAHRSRDDEYGTNPTGR